MLGRSFRGCDGGSVLTKMKLQGPLAGDCAAVHPGRGELPFPRCLESPVGEIPAGSRRVNGCAGNTAVGIDLESDTDFDVSLNSVANALGHVGDCPVSDYALHDGTLMRLGSGAGDSGWVAGVELCMAGGDG